MKKLFYLFFVLLFLLACKTQNDSTSKMTPESAKDIYLSYLSVNQDALLSSYFSKCQLEFKEKNNIGVYTCTINIDDSKDYIFVISDSAKLKGEVNLTKKDAEDLVYIANVNIDKEAKKLVGEKLLFSISEKIIIDNQEIKQHF